MRPVLVFTALIASGWLVISVFFYEPTFAASWEFMGKALNRYKQPRFSYVDASPHGFSPSIAALSTSTFVIYSEFNPKGITEIRVKRWGGKKWSKTHTVLNKDSSSSAYDPTTAIFENTPYAAWTEKDDENTPRLYVTHRSANGWLRAKGPMNVDPHIRAGSPALMASSSELFLAWTEGAEHAVQRLYLGRMKNDQWEIDTNPLNRNAERDAHEPSFAHNGKVGYLAWAEPDANMMMRVNVRKVEGPQYPLLGDPIGPDNQTHAVSPAIAIHKGRPYVAMIEVGSQQNSTQISLSYWEKGKWITDPSIGNTNALSHALSPTMIAGGESLFLAWTETAHDDTPRIHLRKFKGNSWITAGPILPMEGPYMASTPALGFDRSGLLAAWKEDNKMGVFKIHVARLKETP